MVELSLYERTNLLNQYRILERLDPNAGWGHQVKILEQGYVAAYSAVLVHPEEVSAEDCAFVFDVLCMFDAVQRPFIDAGQEVPRAAAFWGFDGNNEGGHLSYLRFLVQHEHRFEHLEGDWKKQDMNSHFPTLEMYGRMLDAWRAEGRPQVASQDQAERILAEKVHPENR